MGCRALGGNGGTKRDYFKTNCNRTASPNFEFGDSRNYGNLDWLAVLAEEFGEVASDVTKREVPPESESQAGLQVKIRYELIQTAAVCVAWLEAIDKSEIKDNE